MKGVKAEKGKLCQACSIFLSREICFVILNVVKPPYKQYNTSQTTTFIIFSMISTPSGDTVFVELLRYFNSDGVQWDVVIRLKKSLYDQYKYTHIWYEKLQNVF